MIDLALLIALACRVLAGLLVAAHVGDLHTTSEILKKGKGYEADPLLGWALNSPRLSEDAKFWLLAAWKTCQAGVMLWLAWRAPSLWLLAGEIGLCVLYAWVLRGNYRIYRAN